MTCIHPDFTRPPVEPRSLTAPTNLGSKARNKTSKESVLKEKV
ncbi:hypothetical protein SLEP1_g42150 [Rubroshorea leprosula]|uniref:Uncharacterized protein n=1 Tax=Rubroshorea leprosula TaxID=152421 RepID=A0AAV5L994_9ROSI|nr:hypothetical protein SLEP1_g42150 [Rubroshorea leprosula]